MPALARRFATTSLRVRGDEDERFFPLSLWERAKMAEWIK
jgi:hypothetical protein